MDKSKIIKIIILAIIVCGVLAISIFGLKKHNQQNNNPESPKIYKDNNYNIRLIKTINDIENDNYLISPYSIEIALNMLSEGANNNTKKEIDNLIGNRNIEYFNIKDRISVANALFIKDIYASYIKDDFKNILDKNYSADFIYDEFNKPDKINNWVNDKTYKMIPSILNDIDKDFVLGMANAVAIDVDWLNEFECENTNEEEFTKSNNEKIKVEMMHQKYEHEIEYIDGDDKVVIIPYQTYDNNGDVNKDGNTLEFVSILPEISVNEYIESLTKEKLDEIDKDKKKIGENEELYLSIPRFSYEYEIKNFIELLNNLGINDAFNIRNADFTNIMSKDNMKKYNIDNLYVNTAIHKTYIDLNESGTKAAAVTYFGISKATSALPEEKKEIHIAFNKPFIYMIRDKKSKEILFFGVVETPNVWKGTTCTNINE